MSAVSSSWIFSRFPFSLHMFLSLVVWFCQCWRWSSGEALRRRTRTCKQGSNPKRVRRSLAQKQRESELWHTQGACIHSLTSVTLQSIRLLQEMWQHGPPFTSQALRVVSLHWRCSCLSLWAPEGLFLWSGGEQTHPPNTMSSCKAVGDSSRLAHWPLLALSNSLLLMLAVQVLVPRCVASVSNNESDQPPLCDIRTDPPISSYHTPRSTKLPVTNKNRLFG